MTARKKKPGKRAGAASAPRTVEDRIYARQQGSGAPRYYLDLRDVDGRRVPLCEPLQTRATTDYGMAVELARIVVGEAEESQRARSAHALESRILGLNPAASLGAFADRHLAKEKALGNWSASWATNCRRMLSTAVLFFDGIQPNADPQAWAARRIPAGPRSLQTISTPDVGAYMEWLASTPCSTGAPLGGTARSHHLSALSRLFRRACSEGLCDRNPCQALLDRPKSPPTSTKLFEVREVALILEAARRYDAVNPGAHMLPVVAVLAYAGLRWGEVCGLEVDEVRRGIALGVLDVTSDSERSVKTRQSIRRIPLAPELQRILEDYCRRVPRLAGPLFADVRADGTAVRMTCRRRSFDSIAAALGMAPKAVRPRRLRVSFATYRAACENVSVVDLAGEMGHSGLDLLGRTYARARMTRLRMGEHLDYSAARWLTDDDVALIDNIRPRTERHSEDSRQIAERFLSAIAGMGARRAAAFSQVDINAVKRLRRGAAAPGRLKGKTLRVIERFLAQQERAA